MYRSEYSGSDLAKIVIATLLLIPLGILANGALLAFAWGALLLPIFPQLPALGTWQAVGISTFVSIFMVGLAKEKGDSDSKVTAFSILGRALTQWVIYFVIVWLVSLSY